MKKKFSYIFILLIFISAFRPLNKETDHKYLVINKNINADEKWQVTVNVERHLDMTEQTISICGDPCNCTRIDFHSKSDIEYSFKTETDVIPQGEDVMVMLESDTVKGYTQYSNTNIVTDLCTGKSCSESNIGNGIIKTAGGYFDYKPSSKEGLLLMNYYLEGSVENKNCEGVSTQFPIDAASFVTLSQPQYMNFSLSDKVDSLYETRKREYDSLQHLLPDWMPKIDFEEIEKSRQTEKDTLEKIDALSYVDKYALNVTEKESGYLLKISYSKSIEIPRNDEFHEGYTKYTFTENITVEIGAPSDITLKQISKDWVPEKDSLLDVTVKWQGTKIPNKLKFTIYDVSQEPGECLNSEDKNLLPDLEFDWEGLFDFEKISESVVIVKPEAYSGNECTISLKSKDFGTFAKLKAEGDFGQGWEPVKADEINEDFIRIPYDINLNYIADKWEKDVGVFGMNLPPSWDEDPEPADQRRSGDGYVLYEEYRGFNAYDHLLKKPDNVQISEGGHFRSDPQYKDVFVFPEGFSFKSLYELNPANLNWHIIEKENMVYSSVNAVNHRWVNNKTSERFYYAKQYAINVVALIDETNLDEIKKEIAGRTYSVNSVFDFLDAKMEKVCSYPYSKPLKCFAECFIFVDNIYYAFTTYKIVTGNVDQLIMHEIRRTLMHEIGHNLGLTHHGGRDTTLWTEQPACCMRYNRRDEFTNLDEVELFLTTERNYCNSQPYKCYKQIDVKSDP